MFYGVEESADICNPRIKIIRFKTESDLKKWMKNYHHASRSGYEYVGRIDKKDPIFKSPSYPITLGKQKVIYLEKYATKIT